MSVDDTQVISLLVHATMELSSATPLADAERERRERELRAVLDALPTAIAVFVPPQRDAVLSNEAWRSGLSHLPPVIWERIATTEGVAAASQPLVVSHNVGGAPTHYMVHVRRLHGPVGTPYGVIVSCVDVTERALAERFGALGALIWSGPVLGLADYYNKAWAAYGRDWEKAVEPADLARCRSALLRTSRERVDSQVEARLQRADGRVRWHELSFEVAEDEGRWYGVARDIHEARDAAAARAHADIATRLKDEFIARASHELRAPLTTMLLWEKVLREPTDASTRAQALDAIRQSALAQSQIVGDLLDVSRAISGKLHVDARAMSLGDVIGAALEGALPTALARRIQLAHSSVGATDIIGDTTRLRQVFDNVLANALKFTEPGGAVAVTTRGTDDAVEVIIRDTGRGIAPEQLERIFQPFHQADDMLTRHHGGLGLGLAISRELVQLHNGTLTAESEGPGRGATFRIRIPVNKSARTRSAVSDAVNSVLERTRVLVIDDDARVRDALALLLQRVRVIVDTASSAANARQRIASEPPDLMICDLAMPGEDGFTFIRGTRAAGCTIPAIALTGHALEADVARAIEAGFNVHIAKPVHFERLISTIGQLISSTKISNTP